MHGTHSCMGSLAVSPLEEAPRKWRTDVTLAQTTKSTHCRVRILVALSMFAVVAAPRAALAQATPSDAWQVEVAPFYFWASQLSGDMTVRNDIIPISLSFSDAVKHLAGTFTLHFEARKRRIGVMSDVMFMRLTTDATFTLPNAVAVTGNLKLNNTLFEIGGTYLVVPAKELSIIGGVRTYNISPTIDFNTAAIAVQPVDVSKTVTDGFVGFTLRPRLGQKAILFSRADIGGGGSDMGWSAAIGVEFQFKPWGGLAVGYKVFGIDVENDTLQAVPTKYDVKQYGPIFGIILHWRGK